MRNLSELMRSMFSSSQNRRRFFYSCVIFLLCFLHVQAGPIIIQGAGEYSFSGNSWSFFQTDNHAASKSEILKAYQEGQFKTVGQAVFNSGIPGKFYWFHFTISNQDSVDDNLVIDIENPRIFELELFEESGGQIISLGKSGVFAPFSQRQIVYKNFIFKSFLKKGQSRDYFLFVNQIGHTLILPIKIFKSNVFPMISFRNYLIDGLTYGILLFVSILSLLFFINTGHSLYFIYGLYVFTAIAWLLSYFGLGFQYIWGNHPGFCTPSSPFLACMNIILNIQICQQLLRLNKASPFFYKAGNVCKCLLLATALFPVGVNLDRYGYSLNHGYLVCFLIIIMTSILMVLISVLLYTIKGSTVARFYLMSSILKVGSIFNLALLELGISPGLYNLEGLLQIGILIEITILTYAIAYRYTMYRLKTFQQVIAAQEEERQKISKEIHDSISNSLSAIKYAVLNLMGDGIGPANSKMQLEKIANEINGVQKEARNISHFMTPDYIRQYSLSEIVKQYVENVQEKVGKKQTENTFTIHFSTNEQTVKFSELAKLNTFRVVQELIANILTHSEATNADIVLSFHKNGLVIISEDNGVGFDEQRSGEMGQGIRNIKSRVKMLNGTFSHQPPGKKTFFSRFTDVSEDNDQTRERTGSLIVIKIPTRDNIHQRLSPYDY